MTNAPPLPITVITGYLGAGKTTLLNRILSEQHGRKYAVIVNEFGEAGIDNDLIVDADEEIFEMNNGCICCTVRGDLIRIIGALLRRRDEFDGMVIETTGLADPAPVIQTFFMDEDLRSQVKLDSVVTVVDAAHFADQCEQSHEAVEQVAFADLVLLNKIDLIEAGALSDLEKRIRGINPYTAIVKTAHSDVGIDTVLDRGAFDLARTLEFEPTLLDGDDDHEHDGSIISVSLTTRRPLDAQRFSTWIRAFIMERGPDILRSKGILNLREHKQRYVFQGVHMVMDSAWGSEWGSDERESRLVFIGRDLDSEALNKEFLACTSPH